ncbi:MAG: Gfo/Idh/MocA family oxidoreductase [Saprospiraceae bacterium]|nr:Gfo/Idh/MocA family oxidoreductase [Saprospiraceae bacterium]
MDRVLKLGLIGLGHLGKIHLKCILQIPQIKLIGCYETSQEVIDQISKEYNCKFYTDLNELLKLVDAVDIVTPTSSHFEIARIALSKGKHCFIEKPVTQNLKEAYTLELIQNENKLKIQVGHVERYNPAFSCVLAYVKNPKFIEAHRLASFNPRGTDVSVIHDLMIHDLDLISVLAQSEPIDIRANGVNIISSYPDICSARIEFASGLVANVTASRISMKQMRKFRIIQEDAYISLDLASKEAQVISLLESQSENTIELETYKGKKYVKLQDLSIHGNNAIVDELTSFSDAILNDRPCDVSLQDGIRALSLVEAINKQML